MTTATARAASSAIGLPVLKAVGVVRFLECGHAEPRAVASPPHRGRGAPYRPSGNLRQVLAQREAARRRGIRLLRSPAAGHRARQRRGAARFLDLLPAICTPWSMDHSRSVRPDTASHSPSRSTSSRQHEPQRGVPMVPPQKPDLPTTIWRQKSWRRAPSRSAEIWGRPSPRSSPTLPTMN